MKNLLLISMVLTLTGCTASYTEPTLPDDHPANTNAAAAPRSPVSKTLDLAAAEPVTAEHGGTGKHHEGHDMGDTAPAGSSSPGMEGEAHEHERPPPSSDGAGVVYACPMHPEVTSDKPGQRCPKCGMALVKQNQEDKP
jgi:hypothetical protein